ncbi:glycosyltransferase [Romboutsia maritimum]|uniref:Glycosyltransferase n=1 Tax=Romboutsia maritimum TaxID=2020948 RepID=A0A371ITP7_9FIRM|nr:glycosyltransferase [Romboutsia maritimum]RDY23851.1 glycosyltransferase [Romboutsia maritimum]
MLTLSLCMILKNEEDVIKRCLNSVKDVVDEIIVVDTGSVDKTKEIVSSYTSNIYDFKWEDNFSDARNFSFSKATKDYIMWMDADEFLTDKSKERLIDLKKNLNKDIDLVTTETHMCMDENNNPRIISRRNRIVKKNRDFKWTGFVHEYIKGSGNVFDSDVSIIHDKIKLNNDRNLKIYKINIKKGIELSDRDLYYYGKELYCNGFYDDCINVLNKFITKNVWKEEMIDALSKIGECYLLKQEKVRARTYFYKTFEYSEPRGEILYNIANSFDEEGKYMQAIRWYEMILSLEIPTDCNQCINLCCCRFKPHLNLCVCYFKINNIAKSYYHHKKCLEINPNNVYVIKNEEFFNSLKNY